MQGMVFGFDGGPGDSPDNHVKIETITLTVYKPIKTESRGFDFSGTGIISGIAMAGSRYPNPYTLAVAGIAAIILWNTLQIYHATEAYRKEEIPLDLSPQALPVHFAQGQDKEEEETDVNDAPVPKDGKRKKNRIPDKGKPNTVETNKPGTTSKKYGPDGNVQKEYNKGHGPTYPENAQDDHIHDYIYLIHEIHQG
ncbi:hypothetical protein [Chryseobacterium sp. JUb7]|uniref:hypothetical protein n=1 Tax=Chryseobacterium sp. JUb7 TaxID=2940599 RepID=UPI002166C5FA|nr:hypothetical protein [Chryseobacterium sp. JUb7]MCS3530751.1 hypothetical protein [Chryseobacterium sp. JUb7]